MARRARAHSMSSCWTRPRPMASRSTAPLFGGRGTLSGRRMKQDLQALEQKRKDVADLRHIRITKRRPFMADHLERLAFIEATSVKTNMARTTGWPPRGQRLVDHAPFGRRRTQTFIGTLRHDRPDAPWVIDGAMNGKMVGFQPNRFRPCVPAMRSFRATAPGTKVPAAHRPCKTSQPGSRSCRPTALTSIQWRWPSQS